MLTGKVRGALAEEIAQALADERERCAVVADAEAEKYRRQDNPEGMDICRWLAATIRERVEKEGA